MANRQNAQESSTQEENFIDTQIDEGIISAAYLPARDKKEAAQKVDTFKGINEQTNFDLHIYFKSNSF